MSSIPWTDRQLDAIQARGGTILVSAAAGSGKTAVLVERVVRLLTDPMEPIDADRLLIVTFSNAAAGEMRQRISERLELLLQEEPGNPRLLRQQMLVESAQISTLLCQRFAQLFLSP